MFHTTMCHLVKEALISWVEGDGFEVVDEVKMAVTNYIREESWTTIATTPLGPDVKSYISWTKRSIISG